MVAIHGIGGVPEPTPERPAKMRENREREAAAAVPNRDDLVISSEAQAAARLTQLLEVAGREPDIRADKVAAARERIERGEYRNPEVVAKVAERLLKYLP